MRPRKDAKLNEAGQVHHLAYRSHGGSDESENLTSLCAAHHLHGVHRGYIRVTGRAPDALRWELLAPPARLGGTPDGALD